MSEMDSVSIMGAEREQVLGERMRSIVTSFRTRVTSVKNRLEQPPSPDENILRLLNIVYLVWGKCIIFNIFRYEHPLYLLCICENADTIL